MVSWFARRVGVGAASRSVDELRELFDRQLRGRVPPIPPAGSVVERDGPLVRTHYGTHGTVDHPALPADGRDDLIARQIEAFAARSEPVEWRTFGHDTPAGLPDLLREAGFTAGWERAVLIVALDDVTGPAPHPQPARSQVREARSWCDLERVDALAAGTGPHRLPFAELQADGRPGVWETQVLLLEKDARVPAAGWAEVVAGTEFVAIDGMTGPHPEFIGPWCQWARDRGARYLVAEADGALRTALERVGFRAVTTVTSFHWAPDTPPARTRPAMRLFDEAEYDDLWDRFQERFVFRPSISDYPGIVEPDTSVTWHLGSLDTADAAALDRLQAIIERGLRACVPLGEWLYWLDWNHAGSRFDPRRVGGTGQPHWPGGVYPAGDYYLYLTSDLRLGTFGHPWEESLCVFGAQLLAEVEAELTALLGTVMRRGGRQGHR